MNERFKFRIWNGAEMHYNDFVVTATGFVGKITEEFLGKCVFNQEDLTADKECTLMQCTGLKDKNGKLIYEGDILLYPDLEEYLKTRKYAPKEQKIIIEYIGYRLMSYVPIMDEYQDLEGWTNGEDNNTPLEVIGNIYENKELLNE